MSDWLAAFDDSGEAHPRATSEFFATAVVAVPVDKVRTLSQQWDNLIRTNVHNCPKGSIELKSSDRYNAWNMTRRNHLQGQEQYSQRDRCDDQSGVAVPFEPHMQRYLPSGHIQQGSLLEPLQQR